MTLPAERVACRIREGGHEAADGEGALEAGDNQVMVAASPSIYSGGRIDNAGHLLTTAVIPWAVDTMVGRK